MTNYEKGLRDVFRAWIEDQVESWIGEYEAWDVLIEDGTIDESDWEWIRDSLTVKHIQLHGDDE